MSNKNAQKDYHNSCSSSKPLNDPRQTETRAYIYIHIHRHVYIYICTCINIQTCYFLMMTSTFRVFCYFSPVASLVPSKLKLRSVRRRGSLKMLVYLRWRLSSLRVLLTFDYLCIYSFIRLKGFSFQFNDGISSRWRIWTKRVLVVYLLYSENCSSSRFKGGSSSRYCIWTMQDLVPCFYLLQKMWVGGCHVILKELRRLKKKYCFYSKPWSLNRKKVSCRDIEESFGQVINFKRKGRGPRSYIRTFNRSWVSIDYFLLILTKLKSCNLHLFYFKEYTIQPSLVFCI